MNLNKLLVLSAYILLFTLFSSCKVGKHIISKEEAQERFATNSTSKFMTIGNSKLHYRDDGRGEPILLIHGFGASLHTWEKIKPAIIGAGYRVITLDLPGFGLSDFPYDDPREADEIYFEYLLTFLKKLNLTKLHVGGNSLGGWVSWEMAYAYPDLVDKLILLNAAGYDIEETNASAIKLGGKKIFNRFAKTGVSKFIIKKSIQQSFGDKSLVSDELVDFYYGLTNREGNISFVQHLARRLVEPNSDKIKEIKNPTLIIWGDKDRLIHVRDATKFAKDLSNDEIVIYQGVGHTPMEEHPEKCAEDIIRFLNSN